MHGDVNGGEAGRSVLNGDMKFFGKAIWRANVPEKVKICVWRCCLNAVPTPSNVKKKKVLVETSCMFCRGDEETIEHLLRDCPRSVAVIAEQKFWIGLPRLPVCYQGIALILLWLLYGIFVWKGIHFYGRARRLTLWSCCAKPSAGCVNTRNGTVWRRKERQRLIGNGSYWRRGG